jgi:MFS family permease
VFIPTFPLVSQWFHRRRALALGLVSAGNGGGALALSFITHSTIDKFGLRWAMIINGIISFAVLLPCILLLRTRGATRYATLQTRFWKHKGYIWVLLWGNFASIGYLICLLTISTYATSGLGLSQGKGALVLAVLAAGQIIGRPTSGLILDRFGRLTMTAILTFTAGLTCLLVWMFSRQLSVLIVFAFLQGCIGGIFWSACGPVTAEVVGLLDMGSAMVILWVSVAPVSLFAETIAISLVDYSTHQLNRTGADAFRISIGIAGGSFVLSSLFLLGAKRYVQGNWNMLQKS